jgi:twitching motility protein PilT
MAATRQSGQVPVARRAVTRDRTKTDAIDPYLEALWDQGGTDLLLTADAPPLMRISGELVRYDAPDLTPKDLDAIVAAVVGPTLREAFEVDGEVDFSFSWRDQARFRGNAFRQRHSTALALRLIPFKIPTFDELAIPSVIREFMTRPHGLVLVTGPTGSGKSTTLAAMIDYINENRACHIVTVEDPIEYLHHHKRSAVNQREIGEDSASFDRALRSVLREDPDVVLIGEMRDPESIQAALTIAETGHLVFATLHTNDSSQALDRIVDVFPADRRPQIQVQLSHVLAAVVYQRLVPRADKGMTAAFEVLIGNHAVRNLIREGKTRQLRNVVSTHQAEGMQTLEMSLAQLVATGVVTADVAAGVSLFPREITLPPNAVRQAPVLLPAGH